MFRFGRPFCSYWRKCHGLTQWQHSFSSDGTAEATYKFSFSHGRRCLDLVCFVLRLPFVVVFVSGESCMSFFVSSLKKQFFFLLFLLFLFRLLQRRSKSSFLLVYLFTLDFRKSLFIDLSITSLLLFILFLLSGKPLTSIRGFCFTVLAFPRTLDKVTLDKFSRSGDTVVC